MPAVSKSQRRLMAIAEHHPSKIFKKNKGILDMSKKQLKEFASTKESRLPKQVRKKKPLTKLTKKKK